VILSQSKKWLLFLALATGGVFLQSVGFGFIQLDDPHHIFENAAFHPPSLQHIFRFWLEPFFGMYIPFTYTVWQLTALLSLSPFPFHLLNVTLHLLNTFLVYSLILFLLNQTMKSPRHGVLAFLGALLFCVHPVQAESVAWISGTKDILFATLLLLALWLQMVGKRKLSLFLFFLSLTSKPTAVIGPVVLFTLNKVFLNRTWEESVKAVLPWFVMILPFGVIAKFLQADFLVQDLAPLWARPLIVLDTTLFYWKKIVFPLELGLDYGRTPQFVIAQGANLFLLIVPLVVGVFFKFRKKSPGVWAGFCLCLLSFFPVAGLIAFQYQLFSTVADRFLYFSLFGVALAFVFGLKEFYGSRFERTAFSLAFTLLFGLGILGTKQVGYWRSNQTLFERAIEVNPDSFLAHNNYAFYLYQSGRPKEAAEHFSKVIEIRPKDALLRMNYGVALLAAGEKTMGIAQLELAQKIDPQSRKIKNALESAKE
jgi:protein O-mannosyl-transferase